MSQAILITIIQILSKVFGFARELVLSSFYGASSISDAFLIALTLPGLAFAIISVGITAGYIPLYNMIRKQENTDRAEVFTKNLINVLILIAIVIAIFVAIFPDKIISLFAHGFDPKTMDFTSKLVRISIWSVVFLVITSIAVPYLNIKNSYLLPSAIGIPLNIGLISGIIISYYSSNLFLGLGILVAYVLQALMLIPHMKGKAYKHSLTIDFKDKYIKEMLLIALPMIVGASANQVNVVIDRTIASSLAIGAISALNYANRLNGFIQGVFVTPITTLTYPKISDFAVHEDYKSLSSYFNRSISILTFVIVPLMFGGMYLSREITGILFLRGAFDLEALGMTSTAVRYYLIGIIGVAYREILFRVFYSFGDTKTPVRNSVIAVVINIILNIILSRLIGIGGLALATSISSIVAAVLLIKPANKYILQNDERKNTIKNILKIFVSGLIMILVLTVLSKSYPPEITLLNFIIQVAVGGLAYLIAITLLRVGEVGYFKEKLMEKINN